jgi:hypothetical protein
MHYERIHVLNGKSMPRKRKYMTDVSSQSVGGNTPPPPPSPTLVQQIKIQTTLKDRQRTVTPSQGNREVKSPAASKTTPVKMEPSTSSPPSMLTSSPASDKRSGTLCRPSAVLGKKPDHDGKAMCRLFGSNKSAAPQSNAQMQQMFSSARARILTFGDGSFSPRASNNKIGSGLSLNVAQLKAPAADAQPKASKPSAAPLSKLTKTSAMANSCSEPREVADECLKGNMEQQVMQDEKRRKTSEFSPQRDDTWATSAASGSAETKRECTPSPSMTPAAPSETTPLRHMEMLRPQSSVVTSNPVTPTATYSRALPVITP